MRYTLYRVDGSGPLVVVMSVDSDARPGDVPEIRDYLDELHGGWWSLEPAWEVCERVVVGGATVAWIDYGPTPEEPDPAQGALPW